MMKEIIITFACMFLLLLAMLYIVFIKTLYAEKKWFWDDRVSAQYEEEDKKTPDNK